MELGIKRNLGIYSVQDFYNELHKIFLQIKISHYTTKNYSTHKALDRAYKDYNDLMDEITEEMTGYSKEEPAKFELSVYPLSIDVLGQTLIDFAVRLKTEAKMRGWQNVESLSDSVSGIGAELKYFSRFTESN